MNLLYLFLFYLIIALIFIVNSKKVEVYYYIVYLLKTNIGIKFMDKIKNHKFWEGFAVFSIIFGIFLLVVSVIVVFSGIFLSNFRMFVLIPGTTIPGTNIEIPFLPVIISIFVVAVIHEASHGILMRKYGVKIKNTGLFLFGPFLGAFVEPDEKELEKLPTLKQVAVYNAGSVANIVTGLIFFMILFFAIPSLLHSQIKDSYVVITKVLNESPAEKVGLKPGEIILSINNYPIHSLSDLSKALGTYGIGEKVTVVTNKSKYNITLGVYTVSNRPCLGILVSEKTVPKNKYLYDFLLFLNEVLKWLFMISIGIGVANMLPVLPFDGGRTLFSILKEEFGEERAKKYIIIVTSVILLALVINLTISYLSPHEVVRESCRVVA